MNWRRGLLLAAINLAVAIPLVLLLESDDAAFLREHYVPQSSVMQASPAVPNESARTDSGAIPINFCNVTDELSPQEDIVVFANMPAFVLTGWRRFCPANWQLAGRLHAGGWSPTPETARAQKKVDLGLSLLIALQWLLVGAFPLSNPRRPWREPGAFITGCAVCSVALVFIHPIEGVARIPALFAAFAWLCWFSLLLWKVARAGWKWATRYRAGTC